MAFQVFLLGFLVFLALYFGIAYVLWRNLKLYGVPDKTQTAKMNITFLAISFFLIAWAGLALLRFF